MKAAVLEKWRHIQVQDIDHPTPGADEVLIRVSRAGVCGSDVHISKGDHPTPNGVRVKTFTYGLDLARVGFYSDPIRKRT